MIAPDLGQQRAQALLAHLYGIRPWEVPLCTESQLKALLGQSEWVFYKGDQAQRDYQFMKLDHEKLISTAPLTPEEKRAQEVSNQARKVFFGSLYALPDFRADEVTTSAATDFWAAMNAGRVPNWVLNLAPYDEIKKKVGEK